MSHQEKQEIFDQLVQNIDPETIRQGPVPLDQFEDWEDLLLAFRYSNISLQSLTKLIFAACDLVQEEQQKRIAENVKVHIVEVDRYGDETILEKCDSSGFPLMYAIDFNVDSNVAVDQSSIINPENLIK